MPRSVNAVFLSYASQDADAARRICDALRSAGLVVWFDQSELRGGDAWDASIRKQVKECRVFVPLVSASTEARSEGYFRREWNLAVDRMLDMADDQAFLLPVAIDDTPQATARVPERFRERQWLRFVDGAIPPGFVARVARLVGETPSESASLPPRVAPGPVAPRKRDWRLTVGVLLAAAIALAAIAITQWRDRASPGAPAAGPAAVPVLAEPRGPDRKSVAVLPFENLSGRPEDAYLADGLQEEILTALARLRDLKVISRTSVMEFRGKAHNVREIGQRLGVGTILEGSIRRDGGTLRLTVQMIDAQNDKHLLAVNYDRDLSRVLELQSTVARLVADSLSATINRTERETLDRVATNSGDAYDRYLRAIALFRQPAPKDPEGLIEPKRLLGEALRFDPGYADAWALLSQVNTWTFFVISRSPADGAAARQAFERALAIDPQLPEALLARGLYVMYVNENPELARSDFEAVLRSRPNSGAAHSVLGYALRRRGRMDEAIDHFVRAWDLDPLNQSFSGGAFVTLLGLRRFPEAIEQTVIDAKRFPNDADPYFARARIEGYLQHSVEPLRAALRDHGNGLNPAGRAMIEWEIAQAEGRYLDAARMTDAVPELTPFQRRAAAGILYGAAGDAVRAQQGFRDAEHIAIEMQKRAQERVWVDDFMVDFALVQSMLGKHAAALATIEAARVRNPETRDATNGPRVSFMRAIILVRAGRRDEGYAEVTRLLKVPFSVPLTGFFYNYPVVLVVKDDPRFDELVNHAPRL